MSPARRKEGVGCCGRVEREDSEGAPVAVLVCSLPTLFVLTRWTYYVAFYSVTQCCGCCGLLVNGLPTERYLKPPRAVPQEGLRLHE